MSAPPRCSTGQMDDFAPFPSWSFSVLSSWSKLGTLYMKPGSNLAGYPARSSTHSQAHNTLTNSNTPSCSQPATQTYTLPTSHLEYPSTRSRILTKRGFRSGFVNRSANCFSVSTNLSFTTPAATFSLTK